MDPRHSKDPDLHLARYAMALSNNKIACQLCPHGCEIPEGKRGRCGVRENRGGELYSLNYNKAIAVANDPIEKKPLFHVLPGSLTLSVATVGCNLRCQGCQNHDISQYPRHHLEIPGRNLLASEVVRLAKEQGASTISFTYSEPTIFMEWAQDIATLARQQNLGCISISNGYTSKQPLTDLALNNLLAANIDLKGFNDKVYQSFCGARLQPVLDTIRHLFALGVWLEVTTLLIPGLNDSAAELADLAGFIASVNPSIPWHLSRFHPDFEMHDPGPTPVQSIQRGLQIGKEAGLRFVYSGNVWGDSFEHTRCPKCQRVVIERFGFQVKKIDLKQGCCPDCQEAIPGVWTSKPV